MKRLYARHLYPHRGRTYFLGQVEYLVYRLRPRWYWRARGY